jgi:DNA-directed RNA polymerase subunit RPC12/RpoP
MPHGCATCCFCSEPFEKKDGSISYHCHVNVDGARGNDVSSIVDAMYRCAKKGELITMRPDWCPLVEVPSVEPVKHEECEYIVSKGKNGYSQEYKCSVCGDSFYWTHDKMFPNKFNYCRNCGRKIVKFIDESKG